MIEMLPTIILGCITAFLVHKTYQQNLVILALVDAHNTNANVVTQLVYGLDAITEAMEEDDEDID